MSEFDRGFLATLFIAFITAIVALAKKGNSRED